MKKELSMKRNNITLLVALFFSLLPVSMVAQAPDEIEAQMNEVKLDERYIYGEAFDENKDIAFNNALADLVSNANEIRESKGKSVLQVSDLQLVIKEMRYVNGTRWTSFVYIPLEQMLAIVGKKHDVIVVGQQKLPQEDTSPVAEQPVTQPQTFKFVPSRSQASQQPANEAPASNDLLELLSTQENWIEIRGILSTFKHEGKIIETGQTVSIDEVPEDAYSILMDGMGGILSILAPKNSSRRINYKTHLVDSETNYNNLKFIVWYK